MTEGDGADDRRPRLVRLYDELKRRRVIRTALWYAGGSMAVIQGADALVTPLSLPEGTVRILAVLALCGLPVALALSWVFDVRPEVAGDPARHTWATRTAITGFVTAGSLATAFWLLRPPPPAPLGSAPELPLNRVAVLALETGSSDDDLRGFSADLHDRLIDGLSTSLAAATDTERERLRVISRAGVLPFSGGDVTTDSIGRALGAGTLVEGSVESGLQRTRVRLRLVDALSGELRSVEVAEAPRGDLVALTDSVAQALERLRRSLGVLIESHRRLLATSSPEAYEHVIRGREVAAEFEAAFRAGSLERAARILTEADSLYAAAAELDRGWSEPVVYRARLMLTPRQMLASARDEPPGPLLRRALELAESALRRDPDDDQALTMRGLARFQLAQEVTDTDATALVAGAEDDLRRAARHAQRPASPLRHLGELLAHRGRLEEALTALGQAYDEDPFLEQTVPTLLRLYEYSFELGRDGEAVYWCREGERRYDLAPFHDCRLMLMAWTDADAPDPVEARRLMARELSAYPEPLRPRLQPRLQGLVAATFARAGEADSARVVLERAWSSGDRSGGMVLAAAGVHALLGETETALTILELVAGNAGIRAELGRAPELRSLRGDPGFQALLTEGG